MGLLNFFGIGRVKPEKSPAAVDENLPGKREQVVHERLPMPRWETIDSGLFDDALQFWFDNRDGDNPPDWASFQPGQHPTLLPHVILYEQIGERFFARVVGDVIGSYLPAKPMGKYLDETITRDKLDDVDMRLGRTLSDGLPNYVEKVKLWQEGDNIFGYNALSMPFVSRATGVNRVLCILIVNSDEATLLMNATP